MKPSHYMNRVNTYRKPSMLAQNCRHPLAPSNQNLHGAGGARTTAGAGLLKKPALVPGRAGLKISIPQQHGGSRSGGGASGLATVKSPTAGLSNQRQGIAAGPSAAAAGGGRSTIMGTPSPRAPVSRTAKKQGGGGGGLVNGLSSRITATPGGGQLSRSVVAATPDASLSTSLHHRGRHRH